MEHIIQLLEASIEDEILVRGEKKELKAAIRTARFSKREMDLLRSKIFDLAHRHKHRLSPENLLDWLYAVTKLTLPSGEYKSTSSAYFSPGEDCRNAIVSGLNGARHRLQICVFTISDNTIAEAIISAHDRGVKVKVITDNDKSFDRGSDIRRLAKEGIRVKVDRTPNHMHHKFCIVDGKSLITGSYNWTRSAFQFNQENLLVSAERNVIRLYEKEFDKLWDQLKDYSH